MRRLWLLLPLTLMLALASGLAWLVGTAPGLQTASQWASQWTQGRLQLTGARGALAGPLHIDQLRWQDKTLDVIVDDIALDWSPSALLRGHLDVASLVARQLTITTQPSPEPATPPIDLQLPVTVDAKNLEISQITINSALTAADLGAAFHSDGRHHQLTALHLSSADVRLEGDLALDGQAPFPISAQARVAGQLDTHDLAVLLTADGQLARLALAAVATNGVQGRANAVVTPFADAPFASLRVLLEEIDPAAWLAGAPHGRLSINADIAPDGTGISGSFGLTNHQPGALDRQRIPLSTLAGTLAWQQGHLSLPAIHGVMPGGGTLAGNGQWQGERMTLALTARQLDAAQLVSSLRPTRLDGPLKADVAPERQQLTIDLRDARYRLSADASHADNRITLSELALRAGDALLSARGQLDLNAARDFTLEGELQRFDPSRFATVPAGLLNSRFQAKGKLAPAPRALASFDLTESRIAQQPLSGNGTLEIAWPRIPKADIALRSGTNQLGIHGAYGQPGDRIILTLDAPQLGPYGLEGGLKGRAELSGVGGKPRLAGEFTSDRLGWPGKGRATGIQLKMNGGSANTAPVDIDLSIAQFDVPDQPALARAIKLTVAGSNDAHRLQLQADLSGKNHLVLAATGGLRQQVWQGQLTTVRFDASDKARNLSLSEPAPLQLSARSWHLGPSRWQGDPLDWRALVEAGSTDTALQVSLSANGSRIGSIEGKLQAGMLSPWSLNDQAPWRGQLKLAIADLGWVGDLIGDGWQSEGRVNGNLEIAGTPAKPVGSGQVRGDKLALRLPAQGLRLNNGVLDAQLERNTLHLQQLSFDSQLQPLPKPLRLDARDDLSTLTNRPGRLEISGEIRVDRGQGGDMANLAIRLDRVGVYQLPDQWVAVSGDGRVNWENGTLGLHGKLGVDAGYWQLAPSGSPRLSEDVIVRRPGTDLAESSLRPKLDIDVTTDLGRNFMFNGVGLTSRLSGELRVAARGRDLPRATGTIRTRGGRFEAYGQKLEIERGILAFNGLLDNPGLDVRAVRKGLSIEPGVQIGGTVRKPVVRLISDPELPETEKLAWLILGHGSEQMSAGDATTLFSAASGLLGNDSGNLIQQLRKTVGLDEFGVRQGTLGDTGGRQLTSRVAGGTVDTSSTTGQQILSVGKRLSSNALLSYEQTLGKAEGVVKLTVNLTRQIAVIGRAGSDNALDLFYTFTFGRTQEKAVGKQQGGQ